MEALRLDARSVENIHLYPQQASDTLAGAKYGQLCIKAKMEKLLGAEYATADDVAL